MARAWVRRTPRRPRQTTWRRRRTFRKKSLTSYAKQQIFSLKRFVYKLNITGNDTLFNGFGTVTFNLGDVANYGEFTSLFDKYKICGIAYRWVSRKDPEYPTTAANKGTYPAITWVHDFDDDIAPSSLNELVQYPQFQEKYFTGDRSVTKWYFIKPTKLMVGYEGLTNSFYSPDRKGFIDMASPTVPHYGIKYSYQSLYAGMLLQLECKYYITCKDVR